jgi:cytochrome c oxidase assembly factor CtaG/polyferredoxin
MADSVSQAVWSSWTFPFWASAVLIAVGLLYLRGWRRIRRTRPELFPGWRAGCFLGGLFSLWIAIASPLDTLDGLLLVAHMTQHLILMSVVPPLLLLGAPTVPLLRALPRSALRDGLGPFFRAPLLHRLFRLLTHPVFAWLAMIISYLAWHVPAPYEFALRSPGWHELEHACFLGTSLLFWFPVIQPWPSVHRGSRWAMLPYLVGADLVNTALAASLTFSGRVLYPSYAAGPRVFGLSALSDQVAAGALMWVVGSIFFLVPLVVITIHLLSPPSQRATPFAITAIAKVSRPVIATKHFRNGCRPKPKTFTWFSLKENHTSLLLPDHSNCENATERPQRFDLLHLPLLGSLLRARYGRMGLQSVAFVVAVLVIADGFRGNPVGAMNLAGVLPWTYMRAFGVIALLVLGNVFCMACPFMLPRELGHRLGLARFKWPRRLRGKWVAVVLMILFFWSYETFAFWDHPARTAWLLIAYFGAAFVVDTLFRGASFCKYVCPLGQFNFAASLLSPFTLEARSQVTCERCTTHDCIAGNTRQRGCELQLYMPQKAGNMDCTLCMDCVKACPHDNIGLFAVSPVRDVLRDPARSSIGRFSSRIDIAVLSLVIVFSAFANAGVMVAPVARRLTALSESLPEHGPLSLLGLLALAVLGAVVAAWLLVVEFVGLRLSRLAGGQHANPSGREVFCRFAQAILPLGIAMWGAHLLFHLFTGWATLGPVIHQAGADFGWHLLPPAHWAMPLPLLSANNMLSLQLLLLDAGLLLTLYLGWRMAQQWALRAGRALLLLLPWATTVAAAYAAGVWILLQPMQMRGVMSM